MKYDINFNKLAAELLPFSLRVALTDLLIVLTFPVKGLHARFQDFRLAMLNRLSYNAQYPYLQRLLNDRFDSESRRIRVYDRPDIINYCVAHDSGQFGKPQLAACNSGQFGKSQLAVYSWHDWGYRPFVVDITLMPSDFRTDTDVINQITGLMNAYRFAGTKYTVVN